MYHLFLDDVFSQYGLVLDGPKAPDKCDYADEGWAEAMAAYEDQLCASTRIVDRAGLDAWLAGEPV